MTARPPRPPPQRRSPVPAAGSIDIHPASVMVCHVAERLCRDPDLIAVPGCPAAAGVGRPAGADIGGPPELTMPAIVVRRFPTGPALQEHRIPCAAQAAHSGRSRPWAQAAAAQMRSRSAFQLFHEASVRPSPDVTCERVAMMEDEPA